uniref:Uncharacterized protein n=1 Tax=Sphaerodactylus townsendi TaxID=933632 RepID=A0ACB8F6W5_9SAUR
MGLCSSSLRPRLLGGVHPPYVPGDADASERGGGGGGVDGPSGRAATKEVLKAVRKAELLRSKSIDKSLKAEKRRYKQTHRLLLLVTLPLGSEGLLRIDSKSLILT